MKLTRLCLSSVSRLSERFRRTPLARSRHLMRLQGWLIGLLHRGNEVRVDEFTLRVHGPREFIARKLILFDGYEEQDIAYLCSRIKPGDVVADVGANIGLYTVYMSRAVGPDGRVLAFEPDPDNIALLRENVDRNHCGNVSVFPFALGAAHGRHRLYTCDVNKGFQSMADLAQTGNYIEIEVRKSADVFADTPPTVMKIDVEGAEPLVWEGMEHYPEVMLLEFVPEQIRALNGDPLAFLSSLLGAGYHLHYCGDDRLVKTSPAQMTRLADQTGRDYNLLALRACTGA